MPAFSLDLRRRIVDAVENREGTWPEVAGRFKVSVSFVKKLLRQRRETGSIEPKKKFCGSPPALDAGDLRRLKSAVDADPDATLAELKDAARLRCCLATVHRSLRRMGYTRKKSRSGRPSRTRAT